ncbi:MAG: hypothetical protein WB611_18355 [Stellaceae bacterium]
MLVFPPLDLTHVIQYLACPGIDPDHLGMWVSGEELRQSFVIGARELPDP